MCLPSDPQVHPPAPGLAVLPPQLSQLPPPPGHRTALPRPLPSRQDRRPGCSRSPFSVGRWPALRPPSSPKPGTSLAWWVLGLGSDRSPSAWRPDSVSLSGAAVARVRSQGPPRTLHGASVASPVLQNAGLKTSQEIPSPGGGSDLFLRTYYGNKISIFIGNGN